MHVIDHKKYRETKLHSRRWIYVVIFLFLLIVSAGTYNYLRPLPSTTVSFYLKGIPAANSSLAWPEGGQSAVTADGYGMLGTSGNQVPLATASMAKVVTALCVLQKYPLSLGQTGPTYTVDDTDVALFNQYASEQGSLIPVQQGETLTEYEALQALMLPSANNIADSLVHWVFGDQSSYATYANNFLQEHSLNNTHIGTDASGFDPSTTSTASDMAQLGLIAAKNPVLIQIVGQNSAMLPVVGKVNNYDTVLGQSNIDGLKTGNDDNDPGAFLFSASKQIGGQNIRLTGAVMGASNLNEALQESVSLAASAEAGFEVVYPVYANQAVGSVHTEWGGDTPILTTGSMQLLRWKGDPVTEQHDINLKQLHGTVGTLLAVAGPNSTSVKLRLSHTLSDPSFWWRLTRH